MSQVSSVKPWIKAINVADGVEVLPNKDGWVTLTAATYVFVVRASDQPLESFNIVADAAIAWSGLTFEDTNAPRQDSGQTTPGTVTDWDDSADSTWTLQNSATAGEVGTRGSGWTVTALTLVKTAAKGAATIHLHRLGSARVRAKVVVTTAGTMRVAPFGKA